jgi:hypothetical protein
LKLGRPADETGAEVFTKLGQWVTGGSTAIQAGGNVYVGPSVSEVRDLALDVFRANLIELKGLAVETARLRAEEITDLFLKRLQEENPTGLSQAQEPAFQDALFTAQKEHAKAADADLCALLVGLLVDRTKHPKRDFLQIVLTESLNTAPKLTNAQIATLSVIFALTEVRSTSGNVDGVIAYLATHVQPFVSEMSLSSASFAHLSATSCGTERPFTQGNVVGLLRDVYAGIFNKGFSDEQLAAADIPAAAAGLIVPCVSDATRKQVGLANAEVLDRHAKKVGLDAPTVEKLKQLLLTHRMDENELEQLLIKRARFMADLIRDWRESLLGRFTLTSVGKTIAHSNLKRVDGSMADLSVWIN